MKKLILLICIVALAFSFIACGNNTATAPEINNKIPEASYEAQIDFEGSAKDFCEKLVAKDYETCFAQFTAETAKALPLEQLKAVWEEVTLNCGNFVAIEKSEKAENKGLTTVVEYLAFEKNGVTVSLTFDTQGKISGIWFNYYEPQNIATALTEGLVEEDLTLGENTDYPLPAKITKSKTGASKSAVVLVHGSGSSDLDETIGANKPFRDIAYGLSAQGIDVLRYNKRTLDYPELFSSPDVTVNEESIEDALLAGQLLSDMGYEKIYLAGHSLGGMLALRIDSKTDLFSGIISLAGSPRQLTDIIIDQNMAVVDTFTAQGDIDAANKVIDEEKAKLEGINSLSAEALATTTIFGMPANYIKDLHSVDTFDLASKYTKPILVLQGSEDFQVSPTKDFEAFKEALKGNPKAQFVLYDGLNHLFMQSNGQKTVEEYKTPGKVDQKIIDDIATFINKG